jgi:aminoglycoside phosphotransferase (APT) family kinase protein
MEGMDAMSRDLEQTRGVLRAWLSTVLPAATAIEVDDLQLPAAGASNETILFSACWDAHGEHRAQELVLRVQPVGYQLFPDGDVFIQWRAMEALQSHHPQIPVPPLLWREPSVHVLGAPFYVMGRVHGEVPNGYQSALMTTSSPEQRRALFDNGLEMLAAVHQLDWRDCFGFLAPGSAAPDLGSYLDWVDAWYVWAQDGRSFPTVERALRALRDHLPPASPTSLLWGDARPGNIMFSPDDQRVTAVLDWELVGLATPETDLAWWLMFERLFDERMGGAPDGVPSRDDSLGHYEKALGRPLADMRYFDVLAWARLAITFIRHVDLERGGPKEQMFTEVGGYVDDCLRQALDALDRA